VEIENSGESGIGAGFVVEKVDVKVGGEGAKATIICWGDGGSSSDAAKKTFPLKIGPLVQYNGRVMVRKSSWCRWASSI
jgi:hypothetical protein